MILITCFGKALKGPRSYTLVEPREAVKLNKFLAKWFKWREGVQEHQMDPVKMAAAAIEVKKVMAEYDKENQ
jgi:hypothetical protein